MLELHTHTTYSDGTLTPQELVAMAATAGVKALAITDHDTLAGWDEAFNAALEYDLEIVPGVELSTVHQGRSLHVLGYYPHRERLQELLAERLAGRKRRAKAMVNKLANMGYPLELPQLEGTMAVCRPHIANAMVRKGYVTSAEEAFTRFLGEDKPAYVHYEKFSATEGIALLRSCCAVPVWAHPYLFRGGEVKEVLPELVGAGLMGLEVYHPHHSYSKRKKLIALCHEYDLIITGGMDYHGPSSSQSQQQENKLNHFGLPLSLLAPLKQAAIALKSS